MRIRVYLSEILPENMIETYRGRLPAERLRKAEQMKNGQARAASLTASVLLAEACRAMGVPQDRQTIAYGAHGKPFFRDSDLCFSISHSASHVCVGFSDEELGVDLEEMRSVRMESLRRAFTAEEWTCIKGQPETRQTEAALRLWTRKESFAKYLGTGLSDEVFGTCLLAAPAAVSLWSTMVGPCFLAVCAKKRPEETALTVRKKNFGLFCGYEVEITDRNNAVPCS